MRKIGEPVTEPFTLEAERDLIRRAKRGDLAARDRLMSDYYETALAGCRHYARRKGVDRDDAESEAYFALEEAIYGFDLRRRGTRFSTYLVQRCRGAITRAERQLKKLSLVEAEPWRYREKPNRRTAKERWAARPTGPVCENWPPVAIAWAKGIRRRNDRYIVQWLWLDERPLRQIEIAKRLKISRAAVSQRRKVLLAELKRRFPNIEVDQKVVVGSFNAGDDDEYVWVIPSAGQPRFREGDHPAKQRHART